MIFQRTQKEIAPSKLIATIVLCAASTFSASIAQGANIARVDFVGTVTAVETGLLKVGDPISGHFIFDLDARLTVDLGSVTNFQSQTADFEIEDRRVESDTSIHLAQSRNFVFSDTVPDWAHFATSGFDSATGEREEVSVEFTGFDLLQSLYTPLDLFLLDLSALESAEFNYRLGASSLGRIERWWGDITSLDVTPVPVPAPGFLLLSALAAMRAFNRKSLGSQAEGIRPRNTFDC